MTRGIIQEIEDDASTELSRLGSQKYLLAVTDATLEPGPVLAAAVDAHHHAIHTFDRWAEDEPVAVAAQAFTAAAGREREARGRLQAELQSFGVTHAPGADADELHAHLRTLDATAERIGAGLLGASLVTDRTILQYVSFFVNEGDTRRANIFRELREEFADGRETAAWIVDERLDATEQRLAEQAATEAIDVAYGAYETALNDLGFDPRPLC